MTFRWRQYKVICTFSFSFWWMDIFQKLLFQGRVFSSGAWEGRLFLFQFVCFNYFLTAVPFVSVCHCSFGRFILSAVYLGIRSCKEETH